MSPGAPDSPDRSCQEPVSTVRRHEQFADVTRYRVYTALLERIINRTPRLKVLLEALEASKPKAYNVF